MKCALDSVEKNLIEELFLNFLIPKFLESKFLGLYVKRAYFRRTIQKQRNLSIL